MLQQIPADPFGNDERPSRTPPPDWRPGDATASQRQAVAHRSTSRTSNSSNNTKNSTNKKHHSVSQSINMLCDKIAENAPTATDGGGMSMMFILQQLMNSIKCADSLPLVQLPGKLRALRNTLPSGPYAKTLFTVVSQV